MQQVKGRQRIFWDTDVPLRTIKGPLYDKYKFKEYKGKEIKLTPYAGNTIKNVGIPQQKMNNFDFTFGFFGPPDMPVRADIVDTPQTVRVNAAYYRKNKPNRGYSRSTGNRVNPFYDGPQSMMEIFIDTPMVLETDLPCSVSGFKY
mgnify:CR=1 FL=1